MDIHKVVLPHPTAELSHCLDERHALNVARRTSELDNADIRLLIGVVNWNFGNSLNPVLDGVGNVRHDLHGFAQIVTLALPADNLLVYFASGDVILTRQGYVEVAFIISQVQINFTAIVKNEDFTMSGTPLETTGVEHRLWILLSWCHSSGIDVHIWIDLD